MAGISPLSGGNANVSGQKSTPAATGTNLESTFEQSAAAPDPTGGMAGLAKTMGFSATPGSGDASQLHLAASTLAEQTASDPAQAPAAFA